MSGVLVIKDGTTGSVARVDSLNRLSTFSITQSDVEAATLNGDSFFIGSDVITLTTDNESAVLSIKSEDNGIPWLLPVLLLTMGPSTGGSGTATIKVIKAASEGSLITGGIDLKASNLNLSSSKELSAVIKKGGEGSTLTNGSEVFSALIPILPIDLRAPIPFEMGAGMSIALKITPPLGNTSIDVDAQMAIIRVVT